ncbi:MAG: hypothetical protein ACLTAX_11325 [Waltera sp.]
MHNTWKRNCSVGMALLMGGGLLLGGCGSNAVQDTAETSAVVVDMEQAQTGKLTLQNSFVGTVSPQEAGLCHSLCLRHGDGYLF